MVLYFCHARLSGHLSDSSALRRTRRGEPGRESFLKKDAGQTGMTECKILCWFSKAKKEQLSSQIAITDNN
jgi:hypothetical protein